ncbi:MAG TPA: hypothetical protein VHY20_15050, partial [Pirellulales bacterium]|nr:hypothetical protein [Pirellulales bacterium]
MSVLDEAFIKAYRKRTQPPAARNAGPASRPAANDRRPQSSLHARGETVPQPHVAFASAAERSGVERPGSDRSGPERPSLERPAAERAAAERPAPERAEAEAAFEVPHFIWPSVVTELLARAPAELSRVSTWLSALVDRSPKVVLMAGMMRGEGRTTVMLALAQAAAQRHLRTVLVDLDFFKPELADRLGIIA